MRAENSATAPGRITGVALGAVGVVAFSMSLPATRVAVEDIDPWLIAFGRAVGAGLLALAYLAWTRAPRPTAAQLRRLLVVAAGVVVGFPLFTSLALTVETAAHGAVVITVLPAITAVFAVLRAGERPPAIFSLASAAGLAAVLTFLAAGGAVAGAFRTADLFLLVAVLLCGLGYAEGGALARDLGGARTICWALILSLPATVPVTAAAALLRPPGAATASWVGFGYLTVVSMFLGFFAWYAGLARGGVARVGQLQLAQPVLTFAWSALLLGEEVTPWALAASALVIACVALTQRARSRPATASPSPARTPGSARTARPARRSHPTRRAA